MKKNQQESRSGFYTAYFQRKQSNNNEKFIAQSKNPICWKLSRQLIIFVISAAGHDNTSSAIFYFSNIHSNKLSISFSQTVRDQTFFLTDRHSIRNDINTTNLKRRYGFTDKTTIIETNVNNARTSANPYEG